MRIFLTGGRGFVGGHLLKELVAEGYSVRVLTRFPVKLIQPPHERVEFVFGDVVSDFGLDKGMEGCEAVIHLVGIIAETGKATFERVHHLGTHNVVEAARRNKISRFVHMSALGARAEGVSEYQTSKWKGEEAVRQSGMEYCILRPSLIFGPGSGFVTQMLDVMRKAPLFRPVPGNGRPLFRPIWVEDVAACFAQALTNPAATNQTIELGGGEELSLDAILAEIAQCAGIRKPAVHVPLTLMFPVAALAQLLLLHPPITIGQLRMLKEGSTCDIAPMKKIFGVDPVRFREGLRGYLTGED